MASIKVHVGKLSDPGTVSCDFRGDKFIGKEHGDHHTTILEKDPASEAEVARVLQIGPEINRGLAALNATVDELALVPAKAVKVSEALGGPAGLQLRIGVWDN